MFKLFFSLLEIKLALSISILEYRYSTYIFQIYRKAIYNIINREMDSQKDEIIFNILMIGGN